MSRNSQADIPPVPACRPDGQEEKGQTDEEEMGITYAQLDEYLTSGELNDKKIKKIIETKIVLSKHKRNTPNIFKSTN